MVAAYVKQYLSPNGIVSIGAYPDEPEEDAVWVIMQDLYDKWKDESYKSLDDLVEAFMKAEDKGDGFLLNPYTGSLLYGSLPDGLREKIKDKSIWLACAYGDRFYDTYCNREGGSLSHRAESLKKLGIRIRIRRKK